MLADDVTEKDGPTGLSLKISPFDEHGQFKNALGTEAGLECDGGNAASRITCAIPAPCQITTEARGFFFKFRTPTSNPSSTVVMWTWGDAASPTGYFMEQGFTAGGALRFRIYGATTADYRETTVAGIIASYGAQRDLCIEFGGDSSGRDCRINGLDVTLTADTTSGSAPANWQAALTSTVFALHGGLAYCFKKFWPVAFRPSLGDAQDSFFLGGGVPIKYNRVALSNPLTGWTNWFGTTSGMPVTTPTGFSSTTTSAGITSTPTWTFDQEAFGASQQVRVIFDAAFTGIAPTFVNRYLGFLNQNVIAPISSGHNTVTFTPTGTARSLAFNVDTQAPVTISNFYAQRLGALFFLSPDDSGDGCGYQLHDCGPYKADAIVPTGGWFWTHPTYQNFVRGTLTWAGTHEGKSLLGQRCFPVGSVVTSLTRKPTVSSSGSGCAIGTSNSATRFQALAAMTANTKALATIANGGLLAGTADADGDLVFDPDTANYTGSVAVTANYIVTEGT